MTVGEIREVAAFAINHVACLDMAGRPVGPLPDFAKDPEVLRGLYRAMVLSRTFDTKAIALQRTGKLGTYPPSLGQEAAAVGVASAMRTEDVLLPSFREPGAQLWRGVTPVELFQYWGGDARGSHFSGPLEDFPVCIPVASHAPHAAGVALAFKLRREARVAVCFIGDGASSKGDFYEALNLAGVWNLPLVFVIVNNQWAISVPRKFQSAAATLAQKGIAAGIGGLQVDGNDAIAVRYAAEWAIERARSESAPSILEAITYRLGDHTTSDDARRYRDDADVSRHWQAEPLTRLRTYLVSLGVWRKDDEERLLIECKNAIDTAAAAYLAIEPEAPSAIFDWMFATLPTALEPQRALASGVVGETPDGPDE